MRQTFFFWTLAIIITLGFLAAGGVNLKPLTKFYVFRTLWTGLPFGIDLTNDKTLIALIDWIIAAIAIYKFKNPKKMDSWSGYTFIVSISYSAQRTRSWNWITEK